MITNIYRIHAYDLIMCVYFCIRFIDFMLNGKSLLLLYKFIFSWLLWEEWQNNTKTFVVAKKMKELYWVICGKYKKFDKPKISHLLEKTLVPSIICSKC